MGGGAASTGDAKGQVDNWRIIKKLDFRVKVTGDVINAMLTKSTNSQPLRETGDNGQLTATQSSLTWYVQPTMSTDMFIEDFARDHMKKSVLVNDWVDVIYTLTYLSLYCSLIVGR